MARLGWIALLALMLPVAARGDLEGALRAYGEGDYAVAAEELRALAVDGNAVAQYYLGVMHHAGLGVEQDGKAAARWYGKAAERGHPQAQYSLANLYMYGGGVDRDYDQAREWYRKAARQGHSEAQYSLGELYWSGMGAQQSDVLAYAWFAVAAASGDEDAAAMRERAASRMGPADLEAAQQRAAQWIEESANGTAR